MLCRAVLHRLMSQQYVVLTDPLAVSQVLTRGEKCIQPRSDDYKPFDEVGAVMMHSTAQQQ